MSYEHLHGMGTVEQAEAFLAQSRTALDAGDAQQSNAQFAAALTFAQQALEADPNHSVRYRMAQITPLARLGQCSQAASILNQYRGQNLNDPNIYLYDAMVRGCGSSSTLGPSGNTPQQPGVSQLPVAFSWCGQGFDEAYRNVGSYQGLDPITRYTRTALACLQGVGPRAGTVLLLSSVAIMFAGGVGLYCLKKRSRRG